MSRWNAYLNTSLTITTSYSGNIPLAQWLKAFYASHTKMGSTDRRWVSEIVYAYFRLGHSLKRMPGEDRIIAGLFLCSRSSNPVLQNLKPEWDDAAAIPLAEKIRLLRDQDANLTLNNIFPWGEQLSPGIDPELFNFSFLLQPDLFLRIRPGHQDAVLSRLAVGGHPFKQLGPSCVALPNATKIDGLFRVDREVVIQDYSSQRTGDYIPVPASGRPLRFWDCCAASGGKSIMAYDLDPSIQLTVTDVRQSILLNLRKRFENAGIKHYKASTADLSGSFRSGENYDIILADLPCTGSGTWARTPEQLYFFDEKKIDYYSDLQKRILLNVIPHLRPGGALVYITCSVFKKENEDVVDYVSKHTGVEPETIRILKGYDLKADSMFVAVLRR